MVSMEEGRSCLKASSSYIQGVLVGVLGSADIYSQFKLIIPPEVRSYFLLIVPWLDGLCVRVYPMKMTQIFEVMRICKENLR